MGPPSPFHFTPKPLRTTTLLMQFRHTSSIWDQIVEGFLLYLTLVPPVNSHSPEALYILFVFHQGSFATTNSFGHPGLIQQVGSYGRAHREDIDVFGSLTGSFFCFIKGCSYIMSSFMEYWVDRSKVILLLVEAIGEDIYLMGTVMLVFGMGLYELFVCNLDIAKTQSKEKATSTSNLFGLFALKERPRWLEIKSVSELKTKLGHCKKAVIHSTQDLLCFSASVLLSSSCLFLLSKLNGST
ncbi:Membrane protein [Gossypium australe]|uniref:Membrane protein n=1 Tax=Gossypium australe TaxID=47621 RepID=A0A5B6VMZ7_9ROSI|nr:Membrane protein [Gossypium australe]